MQRPPLRRPTRRFPQFDLYDPPVDVDAAYTRQVLSSIRSQYLIGPNGLVAKFERSGDPLFELHEVAGMLAGPNLSYEQVLHRFLVSVAAQAFPVPGSAHRDGRVRDLLDFWTYIHPRPAAHFPATKYPLRPDMFTVRDKPAAMRARRSVWRRWITAMGWPLPPELQPLDTPPVAVPPPPSGKFVYDRDLSTGPKFVRYLAAMPAEKWALSAAKIVKGYRAEGHDISDSHGGARIREARQGHPERQRKPKQKR